MDIRDSFPGYYPKNEKKQTNFDKIKAMTVEEMADKMGCPYEGCIDVGGTCVECCINWLNSEVTT